MERSEILGKRIECIIGLIILIPPLLGVLAFTISIFSESPGDFASMRNLSPEWSAFIKVPMYHGVQGSAAAMSSTPIYLGIMALVGAYLVKDSLRYFFIKNPSK